jgi:two-component system, OmpR family, response regulator TrcR
MYRTGGFPILVLLVDDERALTNLVRMALQYEGWQIDIAHDAREAVDKYRTNTPDILVLDIMLPDVDGLRVLQQIRDSDTQSPPPSSRRTTARSPPNQSAGKLRSPSASV